MVNVLVAGYKGRMGQTTVKMVLDNEKFTLAGVFDPHSNETKLTTIGQKNDLNVPVYTTFDQVKAAGNIDVWIDFTQPQAVFANAKFALQNHISPVIGTTGLNEEQVAELKQIAKQNQVGGLIAPNFGISAVLLMQFAKQAAKYMPDVEIIEMHHDNKLDAPSGTALNTARLISEVRQKHEQGNPDEKETLKGARGANYDGMHIHAVRLPGYVAHEQVLFGAPGEALTIRQDSFDRVSFMGGVAVATEKITQYNELLVGLENLL